MHHCKKISFNKNLYELTACLLLQLLFLRIIMVVGAGRGPLVRAALNASMNTKIQIKVYAVEKNPNAVLT